MDDWLGRLASALDVDPPSQREVGALLGAAREVAHRVERKITPVASFVLGMAVASRIAAGEPRDHALESALEELERILPEAPADDVG